MSNANSVTEVSGGIGRTLLSAALALPSKGFGAKDSIHHGDTETQRNAQILDFGCGFLCVSVTPWWIRSLPLFPPCGILWKEKICLKN